MLQIVSDSTCDLSPELIDRYGIHILPLCVHLGEKSFRDGVDICPDEIYRWAEQHDSTPRTAAILFSDAEELFSRLTAAGDELICFSISDQMSSTGNVMRMAAASLQKSDTIHIVDSANLSTGVGLLALEAAVMAREGRSAREILDHVEGLRPKVRTSFLVDTLRYLHRGGRCSGIAAFAGSRLRLHPKIVVRDGTMQVGKKYRGKMETALPAYVRDIEPGLRNARPERVFITHSGCGTELVEAIYSSVESLQLFREICVTRAGGVVSSHCGPGTLGVLYVEK